MPNGTSAPILIHLDIEMEALARGAALIQQIDAVAGEEIDSMILDQSSEEKNWAN